MAVVLRKSSLSEAERKAVASSSADGGVPIDDPCWGGRETDQHDLRHLLRQIEAGAFDAYSSTPHRIACTCTTAKGGSGTQGKKDTHACHRCRSLVLYEDENYVAIAKPPDLRMDGPHPATVHKLLTYWYPPPSLIGEGKVTSKVVSDASKDGGACACKTTFNSMLAERVSALAKHSDLPDNALRPVHQLDYATSGVLLVARTRKAARVACRAFEERTTSKEYVAVVCGHVNDSIRGGTMNINGTDDNVPILPKSALSGWTDGTTERAYRKGRNNVNKKTFVGFMPMHAVFGKWKGVVNRRRKRVEDGHTGTVSMSIDMATIDKDDIAAADDTSRRKQSRCTEEPNIENPDLMLQPNPSFTAEEEADLLSMKWKDVKKAANYVKIFQDMAERYNASLSKQQQFCKMARDGGSEEASKEDKVVNNKTQKQLPTIFRIEGEEADAFYIHAPLAEVSGHFRVYLDDSSVPSLHPCREYYTSAPDDRQLDFKPSLTRCVVLWRGEYKGSPVSKVLLQPRTGRRHQLRLHLSLLNHPILGDVTYLPPKEMRKLLCVPDCHRMCLHAYKLSLPLLCGDVRTFTAPDPFVVVVARDDESGEDTSSTTSRLIIAGET